MTTPEVLGTDEQREAIDAVTAHGRAGELLGTGVGGGRSPVVIGDQFDFLPQHAAGGVNILNRHRRCNLRGLAVGRRRTCQRRLEADFDVGTCRHHCGDAKHQDAGETQR